MRLLRIRVLVLFATLIGAAPAAPVVHIAQGALRGVTEGRIEVFKGIPYAQPPVGPLRWRAPQAAPLWNGVRDAAAFGHACLQPPGWKNGVTMSEDCLYLNVWRPSALRAPAPVLVWIHGGGDLGGAASQKIYDGSAFARQGLVFVSFNYRLGRLGFFDHPALERAHEGPVGNFAIMDMIAALQWVKTNVASFDGDPRRLTVMGESSGAASVVALLISPHARGLFSQAIVLSGASRDFTLGGLTATTGTDNAAERGRRFGWKVGIHGDGVSALRRLRALPGADLLQDEGLGLGDRTTYTDGEIVDGNIIPSDPETAFESGSANYVPILTGSTSAELPAIGKPCVADPLSFFGVDGPQARIAYAGVSKAHLGRTLAGNIAMNEPARYLAGVMRSHGKPAWIDRFGYIASADRNRLRGAPHASDLPYDFDTIALREPSPGDAAMARAVNAYYANFALYGNPNGPGLPAWQPYAVGSEDLMDFTTDRGAVYERDPLAARLDLIAKVRERKRIVYRGALPSTNFVFGCAP